MIMKKICKNITEYPMVFAFFAICLVMLCGYIFRTQDDFSQMENRFLQKRPALTLPALLDGSFMDAFEVYTNEQIPLRGMFVKCKAATVAATLSSENDGIAKGKDSYLFDKVTAVDDKCYRNIAAIENFAKNSGRDVYVAIAPTSTWVNAGLLPAGMPVLDEASMSNELTGALRDIDNAHMIYLYDTLREHAGEQLYYRTDHHWTTKGAGYAYEKIASDMGLEVKDITKYTKHTADGFLGTHYAKYKGIGIRPDTIEYYDVPIDELRLEKRTVHDLFDEEKLSVFDKYGGFMYGNDGCCKVVAQKGAGRELLIFKDSYANCLIPYLVMNYDSITVVDLRYFGGSVQELLDENGQTDVLLLYNWTFVNDDNHFYKLGRVDG